MRYIIIVLSFFIITCGGGGGGGPTEPTGPTYVVNLASLSGNAQKGPFNNGTAINIAELSNTLSPTGRNFSAAITDNTGLFSVANVQLESPYVELRANGYYFNEVSNQISSGQLTLFALSNLSGKTSLNVNILTHLEKNRMGILMSGDSPKTFAQAKLQAQEEVFAIFGYSRANVPESELLDISQGGAANGKLLAISAIVQGDLTVGQMSELLANISTDIASDGTLDDATLRNTLISNTVNLDLAQIRANLEARYASLGISATIPDFETEVNQFLKPPVVQDINASTNEDVAINITLAGSDPEGEALTYTILEVNNATVTLNNDVANYLPDANFNGTDTFTYYANDGTSDSNIGTVTMTVNAEDDDPNTQNVSATTDEDVAVVVQLAAEEYDGDSYSFAIVDDPTNGSVSLDGTTVTYTPNQDFNGTDTFTFEATDDTGRFMNVGTATITINPINDAPVLVTTSVTESVNEEASVDITITATDVDGDQLTFDWNNNDWSGGSDVEVQGDITINGNIFTFAANPNTELAEGVTTTGQFYYLAQDSEYNSDVGLATVTITGVDDLPHADDKNITTAENSAVDVTLSSTDPDGGDNSGIQYEVTQDVSNGSISFASTDVITYTPTTDFHGSDQFKYRVVGDTSEGTVDITVIQVLGTVKTFSEFRTDHDQFLSDIVYIPSTGGFAAVGAEREMGDESAASTQHLALNLDSDLSIVNYTNDISGIDNFGQGYGTWGNGERPGPNISSNSINGDFFMHAKGALIWSISASGVANGSEYVGGSGGISSPTSWDISGDGTEFHHFYDISNIIQTSDGGGVVSLAVSLGDNASNEAYPAIAKMDSQGALEYYLGFKFDSDESKKYYWESGAVMQGVNDNEYYIIGESRRVGFSSSEQIRLFKLTDTGSEFTLDELYNLSSLSGAPTEGVNNQYNDVTNVHEASSSLFYFSLATGGSVSGISFFKISDPNSNPTITYEGTADVFGGMSDYFEIKASGNDIYYASTNGNSNIQVGKVDASSMSLVWDKSIDVFANQYQELFGGLTVTDNGVAISGRYRESENGGDYDAFILILDSNGE